MYRIEVPRQKKSEREFYMERFAIRLLSARHDRERQQPPSLPP
jgi:hypothetical protein